MSDYVVQPDKVEKWPLSKHVGVESKLLVDGANMTVLMSCWASNAIAPEHIHPHEQIGVCLEGQVIFTINGRDVQVNSGEFYHIPSNTPHAERNESTEDAILTDFFSPVREDLLQKRFEAQIAEENGAGKSY